MFQRDAAEHLNYKTKKTQTAKNSFGLIALCVGCAINFNRVIKSENVDVGISNQFQYTCLFCTLTTTSFGKDSLSVRGLHTIDI